MEPHGHTLTPTLLPLILSLLLLLLVLWLLLVLLALCELVAWGAVNLVGRLGCSVVGGVGPLPYISPPAQTRTTHISFAVSVPVLSEQMVVADAMVSHASRCRTCMHDACMHGKHTLTYWPGSMQALGTCVQAGF